MPRTYFAKNSSKLEPAISSRRLLKISGRVVAILLEKLGVKIAHHVVERLAAVAAFANLQVEQQAENCALVVVRHLRVYRIFVLPVELYPRIEARLFNALLQASRRVLQRLDRARRGREKLVFGDQSRASQRHVGVVVGNAFCDPQQFRVVLLRVIEWAKRVGTDSFDVPEMKEFVRDEREKAAIIAFGLFAGVWRSGSGAIAARDDETKTRITERGRVCVLETAARVRCASAE